jgi:hypothetical protein
LDSETKLPFLQHGRLVALNLENGDCLPLMVWQTDPDLPTQVTSACPENDRCTHGRHPHLVVLPDGSFKVDDGTAPSEHDANVRAAAEGLTVRDLRLANRMALALFQAVTGSGSPCLRCGTVLGDPHHPMCHFEDLTPRFPQFGAVAWQAERDMEFR